MMNYLSSSLRLVFLWLLLAVGCASRHSLDPGLLVEGSELSAKGKVSTDGGGTFWQPPGTHASQSLLKVHFIDVGQGDAILLQASGRAALIDGGGRGSMVLQYLKKHSIKELDFVISTHPHADHIGGLIEVIKAIPVREVIDPAVVHTTNTFHDYLALIDQRGIKFAVGRAGLRRSLGEVQIKIIHPQAIEGRSLNDCSIVVRVSKGSVSFLLTGDVEARSEEELVRGSFVLRSTVLKVAHHGSQSSSTDIFLRAVDPDLAVVSVGRGNRFGHPSKRVLERLAARGVRIYRTDVYGSIVMATDGVEFYVQSER